MKYQESVCAKSQLGYDRHLSCGNLMDQNTRDCVKCKPISRYIKVLYRLSHLKTI